MEAVHQLNIAEKRQYPPPFIPTNSQKKNKALPFFVSQQQQQQQPLQKGIQDDLEELQRMMDEDTFYMFRFKTAYCPQKNLKHDWAQCVYAHKPQDYRRPPDQFVYLPDDCKNAHGETTHSGHVSTKSQSQASTSEDVGACPLGFKCQNAHSTYERLYHPLKYKTNPCDVYQPHKNTPSLQNQDSQTQIEAKICSTADKIATSAEQIQLGQKCRRGERCAFYHEKNQRRNLPSSSLGPPETLILQTSGVKIPGSQSNQGNMFPVNKHEVFHQSFEAGSGFVSQSSHSPRRFIQAQPFLPSYAETNNFNTTQCSFPQSMIDQRTQLQQLQQAPFTFSAYDDQQKLLQQQAQPIYQPPLYTQQNNYPYFLSHQQQSQHPMMHYQQHIPPPQFMNWYLPPMFQPQQQYDLQHVQQKQQKLMDDDQPILPQPPMLLPTMVVSCECNICHVDGTMRCPLSSSKNVCQEGKEVVEWCQEDKELVDEMEAYFAGKLKLTTASFQ